MIRFLLIISRSRTLIKQQVTKIIANFLCLYLFTTDIEENFGYIILSILINNPRSGSFEGLIYVKECFNEVKTNPMADL